MEDASALNSAQHSARFLSLTHTAATHYGAQQERFTTPQQSTWEGHPSTLRGKIVVSDHLLKRGVKSETTRAAIEQIV
jgi:hypothetical protein